MSKENFEAFIKELDEDYEKRLKEYCDLGKKSRGDYIQKAIQLLDNLYKKYQGAILDFGMRYDKTGDRWASVKFRLPGLDVTEATMKFYNGPGGGVFLFNFKKNEINGSFAIPHTVELDTMTEFVAERIRKTKTK